MTKHLDAGWLDPGLSGLKRSEAGPGSGLSRAVAARLGVDVVLVRVAFALLALSGGIGVAVYLWGTALTPGRDGARPIDSLLPSFRTWGQLARQAVVVATSVALVALVSSVTPLPWGPGALLLAILALARRGHLGRARTPAAPAAPYQAAAETDDQLVARWRTTMEAAAGTDRLAAALPEVDLYSPAPPRPAAPRPPAAWAFGALVVGAGAAVGALASVILGSGPMGIGAGLLTAGLLTVGYAVVRRERRVPRPVLVALVAGMIASGWLTTQAAGDLAPASSPTVMTVKTVAESRVVDLRDADLSGLEEIRVEAVAADVTVLLPAWPTEVTSAGERLSEVTTAPAWPRERGAEPLDVRVVIDATLSRVRIEE